VAGRNAVEAISTSSSEARDDDEKVQKMRVEEKTWCFYCCDDDDDDDDAGSCSAYPFSQNMCAARLDCTLDLDRFYLVASSLSLLTLLQVNYRLFIKWYLVYSLRFSIGYLLQIASNSLQGAVLTD
jgi:hypothetical protein